MLKILILLPLLCLIGAPRQVPTAQQPSGTAPSTLPAIPAQAAAMINPIKPTAESQAHAKRTYGWDCAVCHGDAGDGKGDLGAKYNLKDWTSPGSLSGMTDGQLFYIIQNGRGTMPAEGDRAKPNDVWNLVILVRSFEKK